MTTDSQRSRMGYIVEGLGQELGELEYLCRDVEQDAQADAAELRAACRDLEAVIATLRALGAREA